MEYVVVYAHCYISSTQQNGRQSYASNTQNVNSLVNCLVILQPFHHSYSNKNFLQHDRKNSHRINNEASNMLASLYNYCNIRGIIALFLH